MKRDNHYEAAFEAYLRRRRLPYVAVDEARRSLAPDGALKSLDFIVSSPGGGARGGAVLGRGGVAARPVGGGAAGFGAGGAAQGPRRGRGAAGGRVVAGRP